MRYYVGFDLGGANNRVVIADEKGKFVTDVIGEKNDKSNGPLGISQQMIGLMEQCASSKNISLDDIVGAGISSAGPLDLKEFGGSIKDSTNIKFPIDVNLDNLPEGYMYKGQPLIEKDESGKIQIYIPLVDPIKGSLKKSTSKDIPVYLGNDVNTAVIGVVMFGEGGEYGNPEDMNYTGVATTHGAGFGGGVWTRKGVLEGVDGNAAEVGHFIVKENGRPCNCGNYGCAEAYGSGTGIAANAREKVEKYGFDSAVYEAAKEIALKNFTEKEIMDDPSLALNEIKAELVFEVYGKNPNDEVAKEVVEEAGKAIGKAYGMIATAYNPSFIATFGGVMKNWDILKEIVEDEMEKSTNVRIPEVFVTTLGNDVGLYGAIGRAMGHGR